ASVQIVEAVVLLVDHDDVPDVAQLVLVAVAGRLRGRSARDDEQRYRCRDQHQERRTAPVHEDLSVVVSPRSGTIPRVTAARQTPTLFRGGDGGWTAAPRSFRFASHQGRGRDS